MGYIAPKENGIGDTLTHYFKKKHLLDSINKNYLVKLILSADNDIIDVAVLSGLPNATEISQNLDDYLSIKEAIYKVETQTISMIKTSLLSKIFLIAIHKVFRVLPPLQSGVAICFLLH
jgi:hypothetical protein